MEYVLDLGKDEPYNNIWTTKRVCDKDYLEQWRGWNTKPGLLGSWTYHGMPETEREETLDEILGLED